jgi:hypothetical protein
MANEQTSVPLYAAAEVLTAANMNISAGTGVPVFATTVTRDAAFGGAGEKVLAEGQLCYLSDTNIVQYYTGAAWATVGPATPGALVLVKSQVIGSAVSSVAVTGAFSATYDTYKIVINGGVASANNDGTLILGSTTTGYYWGRIFCTYSSGSVGGTAGNNAGSFAAFTGNTNVLTGNFELQNPFDAEETIFNGAFNGPITTGNSGSSSGYLNNQTSYTDFTLAPGSGTITGGTIYVYGYAKA